MDRAFSPLLLTTALILAVFAMRQAQPGFGGESALGPALSPAAAQQELATVEAAASRTLEAVGRAEIAAACAGDPQLPSGSPPLSLSKPAFECVANP